MRLHPKMRYRVANEASDEVGRRFVSRYSLLESGDDIDQLQIFSAREAQNLSPNAVYATCHMHVVPCCVAESAAEAALQARFTWAFGGLAWVIEMRYYYRTKIQVVPENMGVASWPKLTMTYM